MRRRSLFCKMEIPYTFAGVPPIDLEQARAAILPVAYDSTTSYHSGTRFGPQEIILASRFLELYDEVLGFEPSTLGIATLPELWPDLSSPRSALEDVERYVSGIIKKGVFPVILGGEHSITLGAVNACRAKTPQLRKKSLSTGSPPPFSVLVLDAHADLRQSYQGTEYNHACVSRRILELGLPVSIIGVRSLPSEDLPLLAPPPLKGEDKGGWGQTFNDKEKGRRSPSIYEEANLKVVWAEELKQKKDWLSLVSKNLTEEVYLSIDLDFFDPAFVPAVGTPEPGGLGWDETNQFFRELAKKHQIIGLDIVELNGEMHHTPSAYFAGRLAYRLLGLFLKP